ncbi:hypothetical protein D3C78_998370 [compost metagenome]
MHPGAVRREGQEGRPVKQGLEIEVGAFADQFEVEAERLADDLSAVELEDLQVVLDAVDVQTEMRLVGRIEHLVCLHLKS